MVHELCDRTDWKGRVDNEGRWPPDGGADWNEALLAPAKVRVHMWVGHGRGADESPRISVRLGTRDLVPGEVAACARLRFDHDRLVPNLGKLVSNDARGNVDNSAGRIGHDHMDDSGLVSQHTARRRAAATVLSMGQTIGHGNEATAREAIVEAGRVGPRSSTSSRSSRSAFRRLFEVAADRLPESPAELRVHSFELLA